jgi:Secretion system C-terminal sorting domain
MKKQLLFIVSFLFFQYCHAQCPTLNGAMINACGVSEGLNEFVLFTTATTANVNTYIVNYGTANPPTSNRMSGVDARTKTGTGIITATGGCTVNIVTDPTTSIPAGAKVIFIPASTDNNYDLSALCAGGSIYVVYVNTVTPIVGTTSWAATGVLANAATTARFVQVTSATVGCNAASAPVFSYIGTSFAVNTDGNFVTWNAGVASYSNNGCTAIVLPVSAINVQAIPTKTYNAINWQTTDEINLRNFIVEKSIDGINFFAIGNSIANGNNSSYAFKDYALEKQSVYYRIVIVNNDGKISNSNIVKLTNDISTNTIKCYPRLAQNKITIEWYAHDDNNSIVTIIDATGRVVLNKTFVNTLGSNKNDIDIITLKAGQYFVRINNGNNKITESFIKQ